MDQWRRQVLKAVGASGSIWLSGCAILDDQQSDSGENADTESQTEVVTTDKSSSSTRTPTTTLSPTSTSRSTRTLTQTTNSDPTDAEAVKFAPNDGDGDDLFGWSVAMADDGSTALVGATFDEDPNGQTAGSAYVFTRTDGSWSQEAKLVPEDGREQDHFGWSVAIADGGDTAIIGANTADGPDGQAAGAAYVFTRRNSAWTQQATLYPNDGEEGAYFGRSVALNSDGSTAVVGATRETDPNGTAAGAAYVFARSGDSWDQHAKLVPASGESEDFFGNAVALSDDGTTAVIGARMAENPAGVGGGAVYVFSRDSDSWRQQAELFPDDGESLNFGASVAVSSEGKVALVGADLERNSNGDRAGAAYVFTRSGESWSQVTSLDHEDVDRGDNFGNSVTITNDGDTAVVGSPGDDNTDGGRAGSAYIFSRSGTEWAHQLELAAADGDQGDAFGVAVATDGMGSGTLVGTFADEDPNGEFAGAAYVFSIL